MKKKKLIKNVAFKNHEFSYGQELTITLIDAAGTVIGGLLTLGAAYLEYKACHNDISIEKKEKENENQTRYERIISERSR